MKRIISFLLCLVTVFSLMGCGAGEEASTPETTAPEATNPPPNIEKKDFSAFKNIVYDTKTWYEGLMSLPIANDSMTEDELRQLCVDAMRYNLTFTWTPTVDINYSFTLLDRTSEVSIPAHIAYSGMFYCNDNARGNVWKALDYYDPETGAMDILAMNGQHLSVLSSACARGCEWGWSRVSNSHGLETMSTYNQYNSNVVPVGPYNYPLGKYAFGSGDGTLNIIRDNGEDVMLQSYAAMKIADGVYSSSSYHVMMCSGAPVLVYDADGKIDPAESYILVHEQDAVGSKTDTKDEKQPNGVIMRNLGTVDKKYTFADLLKKGYIPFTIKELIGEDPVEPSEVYVGSQDKPLENGADILLSDLFAKNLFANYAICTIEVQAKTPEGELLLCEKNLLQSTPHTYHASIRNYDFADKAAPYANGKNTVHIYVRLANGELIEAYRTVLKVA